MRLQTIASRSGVRSQVLTSKADGELADCFGPARSRRHPDEGPAGRLESRRSTRRPRTSRSAAPVAPGSAPRDWATTAAIGPVRVSLISDRNTSWSPRGENLGSTQRTTDGVFEEVLVASRQEVANPVVLPVRRLPRQAAIRQPDRTLLADRRVFDLFGPLAVGPRDPHARGSAAARGEGQLRPSGDQTGQAPSPRRTGSPPPIGILTTCAANSGPAVPAIHNPSGDTAG